MTGGPGVAVVIITAALGFAAALAVAAPEPRIVRVPDSPAELRLDERWQPLPLPPGAADPPLGAWRHPSGATLVLTRTAAPATDAWRDKDRAAWAADVEAGVRAASPGYQRRERKLRDVAGVPTLDLRFRRKAGGAVEVVAMRFLFLRTHTATIAIAVPDARWSAARSAVEAAIAGFAPPVPLPPVR